MECDEYKKFVDYLWLKGITYQIGLCVSLFHAIFTSSYLANNMLSLKPTAYIYFSWNVNISWNEMAFEVHFGQNGNVCNVLK